jgi:hypothetical protein
MTRRRWIIVLASVLGVLVAFDAWATLRFLDGWVNVYEGVPWMAAALAVSPVLFWAIKVGGVGVGATLTIVHGGRLSVWALVVADLFYSVVAVNHVRILLL